MPSVRKIRNTVKNDCKAISLTPKSDIIQYGCFRIGASGIAERFPVFLISII